ncbi:PepSY domain-containing protein [Methylosinus sp. Sm6]|uniref:PepSY-associated TM helix domain-containing protein n=1 Tax=Methylosinus sp. Sm6 TaxID=2866948 RepID=UPI001C9A0DEC|nr:PepSY-associated TM helix domain-containing protein [Methylosinus sp. Sm6]MBY6241206.1 PepSY domain-containing protein [Methylosinus sp. Sm6]
MTEIALAAPASARRLSTLRNWREIWRAVHLWLGLALGLFLSVIGVTGSALVFFQEIDQALNPELRIVAAPPQGRSAWRPLEEIAEAARKSIAADARLGFTYWPQSDDQAFLFYYRRPVEGAEKPQAWHVFVDPYSAKVTGERLWRDPENMLRGAFVRLLFDLHYDLLWPVTGDLVVGVIALLAFVSTFTGVYLWWPRNGKWKNAFTMKWPAKAERVTYDLHRLSGIFLLPVAIAVLMSGVYFNLPEQFRAAVELFSPLTKPQTIRSLAEGGRATLDDAVATVQRRFPGGRVYSTVQPATDESPYAVNQLFPIGFGLEGRRTVFVDRYSGEVRHVNDPLSGDGDGFIAWQWPLHSGYVAGWPGRIAVFLFGLSWPLVFVTGVIRWMHKRNARRAAAKRGAPASAH